MRSSAMNVLLLMVNQAGFDPKKISVAGYGQFRPIADDSTAEGRRMNRRVDLVVVGSARAPRAANSSTGAAAVAKKSAAIPVSGAS
jgi:hypothetical protein